MTEHEKRCKKTAAAAEYLGISRRYLSKLAENGDIPYSKCGKRVHLYDIADLDKFVEERRV